MKQKRDNILRDKRGMSRMFIIGILLLIFLGSLIIFVSSQGSEDLQSELNSLENELSNKGYDWLVNYSEINLNWRRIK